MKETEGMWQCASCGQFELTPEEFHKHYIAVHLGEKNVTQGPLAKTRQFETGATRDQDSDKLDYEGFLSPVVLEGYAQYMHRARLRNVPEGQTIRASDNWQKGIPKPSYVKSLLRHAFEIWRQWRKDGSVNREAAYGVMFNVMGLLFEDLKAGPF